MQLAWLNSTTIQAWLNNTHAVQALVLALSMAMLRASERAGSIGTRSRCLVHNRFYKQSFGELPKGKASRINNIISGASWATMSNKAATYWQWGRLHLPWLRCCRRCVHSAHAHEKQAAGAPTRSTCYATLDCSCVAS